MTTPTDPRRAAGVLLHPTALPGTWGSGDFGFEAEGFLDWAAEAGFSLWQILPVGPPAGGHSPYTCLSAFAINPMLISIDRLVDEGLLSPDDVQSFRIEATAPFGTAPQCDWQRAAETRNPLLRLAFERFRQSSSDLQEEIQRFSQEPLQEPWLEDWCLFSALRRQVGASGWWTWEPGLARRHPEALAAARHQHKDAIDFERFLQFIAHRQWQRIRKAAADRGIQILGDLPIYVAHDSADVWAHPELFELDEQGRPTRVAGVPPDYFSEDGQLWGNPLYRWDVMEERGFDWWIDRLRTNLGIADQVRLDHFRAFAGYWVVDAGAENAKDGQWMSGPGEKIFRALTEAIGAPLPLVAEDLGDISEDVHQLRHTTGLPCMRVLQFGFELKDSEHAPHRLTEDTLLYTGTHDNDTTLGWYWGSSDETRNLVRCYSGGSDPTAVDDLIRLAYTSVARWAVLPMQDILHLGSEARFNTPGIAEGNWGWRLPSLPDPGMTGKFRWLAEISGRLRTETYEPEQ